MNAEHALLWWGPSVRVHHVVTALSWFTVVQGLSHNGPIATHRLLDCWPGLRLGTKGFVMTPNGVDFSFASIDCDLR